MSRERKRQITGVILSLLLVSLSFAPPFNQIISIPRSARMVVGEQMEVSLPLPRAILDKLRLSVEEMSVTERSVIVSRQAKGYQLTALRPGRADVTVKLLGHIPLKSILVESLPPYQLLAGGHSIGILLQSQGIMVVGFAPINDAKGNKVYPAREVGFEVGDLIMEVNGEPVYTELDLAEAIDQSGQRGEAPRFLVKRDERLRTVSVPTVLCPETGRYRIGLYVRDGVAGVGTLTVWDPESYRFAALGHIIVDSDTKQAVTLRKGRIVSASIQAVQPGRPGKPGEKIGVFDREGGISGKIEANTFYGVFGISDSPFVNSLYSQPLPVAYAHQVHKGPAEILTVISGNQLERFDIFIEKVYPFRHNGKGMVLRVTDQRLLSVAGGIIQGMSGSPIIQDGRIAGAVTHVFLNNPEKGYGIFMDTMLEEMNSLNGRKLSRQKAQ